LQRVGRIYCCLMWFFLMSSYYSYNDLPSRSFHQLLSVDGISKECGCTSLISHRCWLIRGPSLFLKCLGTRAVAWVTGIIKQGSAKGPTLYLPFSIRRPCPHFQRVWKISSFMEDACGVLIMTH
jgi:hypothetical protein